MATKVHTLAWHKTQFNHSDFKNKTAVHKEAQRRRNLEVTAKKQETKDGKTEKKKKKNNRRYKPKYKSMSERRHMVQIEKTHRWCGGWFFQCHGTGEVNGMRHAPCKGNGIVRIRGASRRPLATGNVTTSGSRR